MSWADQGFSWELTNPREIMWHLYRAFEERATTHDRNTPILDFSKIERGTPLTLEAFHEIDNWIIHTAGAYRFFSEPDQAPPPPPSSEGEYGTKIFYPMTIEKLESHLGEPMIIPNRAITKFPRKWAVQRYRIANLLYEWFGDYFSGGLTSNAIMHRELTRNYNSGMVEDFEEEEFFSSSGHSFPTQCNSSVLRINSSSIPYWTLEQKKSKSFLGMYGTSKLRSCHCKVYVLGRNVDAYNSLTSADVTLEYQSGGITYRRRSIYDDYGTGIQQGVYTAVAEYDYASGEDIAVEFPQDFPDMNTLPLFNTSDVPGKGWEIGIYQGYHLYSDEIIARHDFAPSYQYYDPPE